MKSLKDAYWNDAECNVIRDAIDKFDTELGKDRLPSLLDWDDDDMKKHYSPLLEKLGYEYDRSDLLSILMY